MHHAKVKPKDLIFSDLTVKIEWMVASASICVCCFSLFFVFRLQIVLVLVLYGVIDTECELPMLFEEFCLKCRSKKSITANLLEHVHNWQMIQ